MENIEPFLEEAQAACGGPPRGLWAALPLSAARTTGLDSHFCGQGQLQVTFIPAEQLPRDPHRQEWRGGHIKTETQAWKGIQSCFPHLWAVLPPNKPKVGCKVKLSGLISALVSVIPPSAEASGGNRGAFSTVPAETGTSSP